MLKKSTLQKQFFCLFLTDSLGSFCGDFISCQEKLFYWFQLAFYGFGYSIGNGSFELLRDIG